MSEADRQRHCGGCSNNCPLASPGCVIGMLAAQAERQKETEKKQD